MERVLKVRVFKRADDAGNSVTRPFGKNTPEPAEESLKAD